MAAIRRLFPKTSRSFGRDKRASTQEKTMKIHFAILVSTLLATQSAELSGELKQWHKVTLTFDGPIAHETNHRPHTAPDPFRDLQLTVEFKHASGGRTYRVPGYF